jgi:hypothetical protein
MSMPQKPIAWIVCLCLFSVGCSDTAAPPQTNEIATMAQSQVQSFVESANQQPRRAAAELDMMMESLDAYANDFGGEFVQLRDTAAQLKELYASEASQSELESQLEKLLTEANALTES